ncbi:MAG: hypothetical protein L0Y36_01480 [Planctomycetales bacterium]|nr:hypothetical protein [Planctomycetales bacterium]
MDGASIAFIALPVIDIPLFILIGKLFFGSWGEFWDAIVFWFTPDFFSALAGEFWDDIWAEAKLGFFAITCGACIYGELWVIVKMFGDTGTV